MSNVVTRAVHAAREGTLKEKLAVRRAMCRA
jgi:hypothetical protein